MRIVTLLILVSHMVNGQTIRDIVNFSSIEEIEIALSNNPNAVKELSTNGRSILFDTQEKSLEINELLLKYGANPNQSDEFGITPVTFNSSNYELFELFLRFGGKPKFSSDQKIDYLYELVFDYVSYKQNERLKIIEQLLEIQKVDLNKNFDNGLTISHLLVINYLTYSDETDFLSLFKLLRNYGLTFKNSLTEDFHDSEYYPYELKKGDSFAEIIRKVSQHSFYNGKDLDLLEKEIKATNSR